MIYTNKVSVHEIIFKKLTDKKKTLGNISFTLKKSLKS